MLMLGMIAQRITDLGDRNVEVKIEKEKPVEKKVEKPVEKKAEKEPPSLYGEIWKPMVEPTPHSKQRLPIDEYLVSNMGNIYDKKRGIVLKPRMDRTGLYKVSLRAGDGHSERGVKILVASAFIGAQNTFIYTVVNNDGNPRNCASSNLRWKKIEKGGDMRG